MSRALSYLRGGLLGIAVVGSLGFGATQMLASTEPPAQRLSCPATGDDYEYEPCQSYCGGAGYCSAIGQCRCGPLP